MPFPRSHHCFVRVNFHLAILAGGFHPDRSIQKQTLLYDIAAQAWSVPVDGGQIQMTRLFPGCGLIKDQGTGESQVVMAGGYDPEAFSTPLVTTELWSPPGTGGTGVYSQKWRLDMTAKLPWGIWGAASTSAPDFSSLYIISEWLIKILNAW